MEDSSFDELTKRLASPISRRSVLKAFVATVAGGMLAGLDGGRVLAVDKKCSGPGGKCNPGHDCCGGLACFPTGPGANGTCGCPTGTSLNAAGVCVCSDGTAPCGVRNGVAACCNAACQACSNGTCVDTCPAGQTCSAGGTCLCTGTGQAPCGHGGHHGAICCRSDQTCVGGSCVCTSNNQPPCIDSQGNAVCCPSNQTCDATTQSCVCTAAQVCGEICCPTGSTCNGAGSCICNGTAGTQPCGVDANGNAICCSAPQVCSQGKCVASCPSGSTGTCRTAAGPTCCPPGTQCQAGSNGNLECLCPNTGNEPCGFDATGTAICCAASQFCLAGSCSDSCPGEDCGEGVCCESPYATCVQDATGRTRCACTFNGGDYCGPVNNLSIAVCCTPGRTVCQNGQCVPG